MAPHAEEPNAYVNGNGHSAPEEIPKDVFTVDSPNVIYTDEEIRVSMSTVPHLSLRSERENTWPLRRRLPMTSRSNVMWAR